VAAGRLYNVPVVCNQVHYSLLDYKSAALRDMEAACGELGVTIVAYSPLGQGLLTDSLTDATFATNKPAKMLRLQASDLQPLRSCLQDLAAQHHKSMAQIALRWCIQHDVVPLVGCRSVKQAKDSLGCCVSTTNGGSNTTWALSEEDMQRLDALALDRSTLDSPPWRRALFVCLFGIVNWLCRTLDQLGYGSVVPIPALEKHSSKSN
jgi:aryl-alcohol dehydrogenase-like predicted oxidoreductase